MAVSEALTLQDQLRSMRQSVDAATDAILISHTTLLCLDIADPGALGRLLAEPIRQQLPVGLGD